MAIAFAQLSIHSRAKGHSAVAAAAYRSGMKITDERTGVVHDFTRRKDVVYTEMLLPDHAPAEYADRTFLWNQVEAAEKRKDAQVCKDIVLALPRELNVTQQIELARRFAHTHFVSNGIPADIAIHDHGDGNPHAHILTTTRRLERDGFSKYKARDLNPAFYNQKIVEQDYWNEQWRDMQTRFFREMDIDLSVDLDHVIPERHEGQVRGDFTSYRQEENDLIRRERIYFALNDIESLINHLSLTRSVFTRRELEILLFKTFAPEDQSAFLATVEKVLAHQSVIALGPNDRGRESYTTENQYKAESRLLAQVNTLKTRKSHVFKTDTRNLAARYSLNEEQTIALDYIAAGSDISLLIGRPGVGKSYLLKPLKDYYESHECRIIGTAMSGKVAQSLESETGITSFTLTALTYRLQNNRLTLTGKDVVIMDEAGMVDFASMAYVVDAVHKAGAKLVLVGDPQQLKPIEKGEIFRGIAAHTGYVEMTDIRRQRDKADREASLALTRGNIEEAVAHYARKDAIQFRNYVNDSSTAMVMDWDNHIESLTNIRENVMYAFSRVAVLSLNQQARELMKIKGLVQEQSFVYGSDREADTLNVHDTVILRFNDPAYSIKSGAMGRIESIDSDYIALSLDGRRVKVPSYYASKIRGIESGAIDISVGDRILLRQNDKEIGVRNGDYAFVESVNAECITARLDSGVSVTLPKSYKHIEHGYATTVHKGQGMTVDNAWLLIDSKYWDSYLSMVGMTRHRDSLKLYADRHQHQDLEALTKTLSRTTTKDNVIDWPLDFAIRAGFNPDSMIGRAVSHITGATHTIRDKWNYLVHYEAWLENREALQSHAMRRQNRGQAKRIADFYDRHAVLLDDIRDFAKDPVQRASRPASEKALYIRSIAMDKEAHALWSDIGMNKSALDKMPIQVKPLEAGAERYARYLVIEAIAAMDVSKGDESLAKRVACIDLKRDHLHVSFIAGVYKMPEESLYGRIENLQNAHKRSVFAELKKEHPMLEDYARLVKARTDASHLEVGKIDKAMDVLVKTLVKDKVLMRKITSQLPDLAEKIHERLEKALDRGEGIEH